MKKITFILSFLLCVFFYSHSFSQITGPETINFDTSDNTSLGSTATDGEGGAYDIIGIIMNITAINATGTATGANLIYNANAFAPGLETGLSVGTDPATAAWRGVSIKSNDGTEFDFNGFDSWEFSFTGAVTLNVRGYKDGVATGTSVTVISTADGDRKEHTSIDFPDSDFGNVDEVRIIAATDFYGTMNVFLFGAAVGASDTTPPVFENSTPSQSSVTQTGLSLAADIDESGTIYYIVVTDEATTPSSTEVKAGTGNGGSGQVATGNAIVNSGDFTNNFNVTGLTPNTAYDVYVVAEDDEGAPNLQANPTKIDVTTLTQPTVTLSVSSSSIVEAAGTSTITATLSAISSQNVTVNLSYTGTAVNGTDYNNTASTSITITAGQTSANAVIGITATQDADIEGNETVIIDITGVTNGTENGVQQQTITIQDDDTPSLPSVTTTAATLITTTGATLNGNITNDGGGEITERGFVYSITASEANPIIGNAGVTNVLILPAGITGAYNATADGLSLVTEYSFKAYAKNATGITYGAVQTFTTLNPTSPTITFANINKTYGDPDFNLGATSNSNGTISYSIVAGGTGSASLSGANNKTVTLGNIGTITIRATQAADGIYSSGTKEITLSISTKEITITADAKAKIYGEPDPTLTYQITSGSLETGDTFSGALDRIVGEDVGGYEIDAGTVSAGSNYNTTFVVAYLTISTKTITVTADSGQNKTYGDTDPGSFGYAITSGSLVFSDIFSGVLARVTGEDARDYAINQGTLTLGTNYNITFVSDNFTINKAALTATADNKTRGQGVANPVLTISYSGFKNSEVSAVIDVEPSISTTAVLASPEGTYPITLSGGSDNNYSFTLVNGTLTVSAANALPDAVDDSVATDTDLGFGEDDGARAITADILGNDSDPDATDNLTVTTIDLTGTAGLVTLVGGVVSYNPNGAFTSLAVGASVIDIFTYTISDGNGGTDTATVSITITGANDAPDAVDDSVSTDADLAFGEDDGARAITADILGNDSDPDATDNLTVTAIDLTGTTGLVTLLGGVVSYDPNGAFESLAAGASAVDTFTYTISDSHSDTDTATVTITINGENDVPDAVDDSVATDADLVFGEDDWDRSINADILGNDTDPDTGNVLTVTAIDLTGTIGQVTLVGGVVSYNPKGFFESLLQGATATDSFTYTVSDGNGETDTATVTITINGVNDTPTAFDDQASVNEDGESIVINVLSNDADIDVGDILSLDTFTAPTSAGRPNASGFASVPVGTNNIEYDPRTDFQDLAVGESAIVIIQYTIEDNHGSKDTAIVTITINGTNDTPNALDDNVSTDVDLAFGEDDGDRVITAAILGNDTDPDTGDVLTVTAIDLTGTTGLVTLVGGVVSYNPNGAFASLTPGTSAIDTFTYTISDGNGGTDTATVSITINGANDAPDAVDDSVATDADLAFGEDDGARVITADILGNDTDLNAGDVLIIYAIDNTGTKGLVTIVGGVVSYNPNGVFESLAAGASAIDTFIYAIADGKGGVDSATVSITINGANDAPDAVDDTVATDADLSFGKDDGARAITADILGNDTDPDAVDVLTVTSIDLTGTTGLATLVGGVVSYDPNGAFASLAAGASAIDIFTYTISDGNGGTDTATVSITINGANDPPDAVDDSVATDADLAFGEDDRGRVITADILGNDTDPNGGDVLTVSAIDVTETTGLVSLVGGVVSYDPNGAFESLADGASVIDTFTYTISDGNGGTGTATVSITINGANDAPNAVDDSVTTDADLSFEKNDGARVITADILGNDTDPDTGGILTVTAIDITGTSGLVTLAGGVVSYDPNGAFISLVAGASAIDTFTYTISDGNGGTNTATVSITITVVDKPTVTTTVASSILATSATLAGNVTADGGASVTERGVVYSVTATNAAPLISGTGVTKETNGTGTGVFSESITSLTHSTQYSFKAYATNSVGTSYGAVQTFTTSVIANPTITFTDIDKTYGDANFDLTVTSNSGGAISYSSSDANIASLSGNTVTIRRSGTVTITASQVANGSFSSGAKDITLTINKAVLTVTGNNKSKVYGSANPFLTGTITGFVNSESFGVISAFPVLSTIATTGSPVGEYPITSTGGTAQNYTFIDGDGTLTITKRSLTVSADNKVRGGLREAEIDLTYTYHGFVNGDTESDLDVPPIISSTVNYNVRDKYPITLTGGSDNNYELILVNGIFSIGFAPQVISFCGFGAGSGTNNKWNANCGATAAKGLATYRNIISVQVFNRSGKLVFKDQDYQNDWEGVSNQPGFSNTNYVPEGTYLTIVDFGDGGGPLKGWLYIKN